MQDITGASLPVLNLICLLSSLPGILQVFSTSFKLHLSSRENSSPVSQYRFPCISGMIGCFLEIRGMGTQVSSCPPQPHFFTIHLTAWGQVFMTFHLISYLTLSLFILTAFPHPSSLWYCGQASFINSAQMVTCPRNECRLLTADLLTFNSCLSNTWL